MASTETHEAHDEPVICVIDGEEIALAPGDELIGRVSPQGLVVTAYRRPALQ